LPYLRALDLSNNPISRINELDELLAAGEKKGKASVGAGSLKSLIELKLNGCKFREEMLLKPDGAETYKRYVGSFAKRYRC
jgi:nuclear RNA export factor